MKAVGRPTTDHTGKQWKSLVVIRKASSLEVFNWLSRSVLSTERHGYWYCVCQDCQRVLILRSDVVKQATKKCLCHGGRRSFIGTDSSLGYHSGSPQARQGEQ